MADQPNLHTHGNPRLTAEQRATSAFLHRNHENIVEAFTKAIDFIDVEKVLKDRLVLRAFRVMTKRDLEAVRVTQAASICCVCCPTGDGQGVYCCDDEGCSTCPC
jgi:hypothetical protein